ncbi:hypothetical protein ACLOJK_016708 [Asimina triloba]
MTARKILVVRCKCRLCRGKFCPQAPTGSVVESLTEQPRLTSNEKWGRENQHGGKGEASSGLHRKDAKQFGKLPRISSACRKTCSSPLSPGSLHQADLAGSSHLFPISVAILGQWRQTSPDPERCPTFCLPIVAATAAVNRVNLRSMSLMDGFFGHGIKSSSLSLME